MIEQKDDKHSRVHLSKLFTWGPNPSCWIHLKNGFVALTIHHWHVAFSQKQICHSVVLIDSVCQLLAVGRISCWLDLPDRRNSLRVRFQAAAWGGSAAERSSSNMLWMPPRWQVMNAELHTERLWCDIGGQGRIWHVWRAAKHPPLPPKPPDLSGRLHVCLRIGLLGPCRRIGDTFIWIRTDTVR